VNLEIGNTYYQITYSDPGLTMPGIKPVVFIGNNIFEENDEDLHYFQDTVSYVKYGVATKADLFESINCSVISFKNNEVGVSIVELENLPKIVNRCIQKVKDLGSQKLQVLNGK